MGERRYHHAAGDSGGSGSWIFGQADLEHALVDYYGRNNLSGVGGGNATGPVDPLMAEAAMDLHNLLDAAADAHAVKPQIIGAARALTRLQPETLRTVDKYGWLPLHYLLCGRNVILELVVAFCDAYPDAVRIPTPHGSTPLHLACMNKAITLPVATYIFNLYPEAASASDNSGRLPLHCAAAFVTNAEVISLLITAYPPALLHRDEDKMVPLHCVRMNGTPSFEVIRRLIVGEPSAVHVKDKANLTPLDDKYVNKMYKELATLLAIDESGDSLPRNLPAVSRLMAEMQFEPASITIEAVNAALREPVAYDMAVMVNFPLHDALSDHNRRLPLHCCLSAPRPDPEVVERILHANRSAVTVLDAQGALPIHVAAATHTPQVVLDMIVKAMNDGCYARDSQGRTPLHMCCSSEHADPIVLERLLHIAPSVAGEVDQSGKSPLHYAITNPAFTRPMTQTLLSAHPSACTIQDSTGHTPLHVAVLNEDRANVAAMTSVCPEAASIPLPPAGDLPLHLACRSVHAIDVSILRLLLAAHPAGATTSNASGLVPAQLAATHSASNLEAVRELVVCAPQFMLSATSGGPSIAAILRARQQTDPHIADFVESLETLLHVHVPAAPPPSLPAHVSQAVTSDDVIVSKVVSSTMQELDGKVQTLAKGFSTDMSQIQQRLKDLDARSARMETTISSLNSTIAAIRAASSAQAAQPAAKPARGAVACCVIQ